MKTAWAALEAGGTKFNCLIGTDPRKILAETRIPTGSPDETIAKVISFFNEAREDCELKGLGIASFGPLDLDRSSVTYGSITTTPKEAWRYFDLHGQLKRALAIPVSIDTDVNGAALGEHVWGAAQHIDTFVYLTVGTGIGGGFMVNGQLLHGLIHPEVGHMKIPHDHRKDPFSGCCPFHRDCLEGLASGPAIEKRWGCKASDLPVDHPAWELEADYLALALHNLICTVSPQKIILGGGIMEQDHIFPLIRTKVQQYLGQYIQAEAITSHIDTFIVPPVLGSKAGVLGALALAMRAGHNRDEPLPTWHGQPD